MSIFVFVSFSTVNGISFSSVFSITAENEKNAFRSASSIHHKKVLVLKKRLVYITDRLQYTAPLSLARSEIMIGDITLVGRFPPLSPFISETVQDRSIFTMDH